MSKPEQRHVQCIPLKTTYLGQDETTARSSSSPCQKQARVSSQRVCIEGFELIIYYFLLSPLFISPIHFILLWCSFNQAKFKHVCEKSKSKHMHIGSLVKSSLKSSLCIHFSPPSATPSIHLVSILPSCPSVCSQGQVSPLHASHTVYYTHTHTQNHSRSTSW